MKKSKKWMTAAFLLLGAGVLICVISLAVLGFDFKKLSTVRYVTETYDIKDNFQNISIDADTEKIVFVPADDGISKVVCCEETQDRHRVRVEGDTLTIDKENDRMRWKFGMIMESPEIAVYLPKNRYGALSVDGDTGVVTLPAAFSFESIRITLDTGDVSCLASALGGISIKTNTGDITISDLSASEMKLESDTGRMGLSDVILTGELHIEENTGKVILENVSCKNLSSKGDTGSLDMTGVLAAGEFHLERDTGDIEFHGCDAETIYVKTNTGSVTGTLLSDKIFITETDTGSVHVPTTATGGRCQITTDTGDIMIEK